MERQKVRIRCVCFKKRQVIFGIAVATLSFLLVSGNPWLSRPLDASEKKAHTATFLCEEFLQGGRQGHSGIVLDLDGDGIEDLLTGAPYARHKNALGAVIIYSGTDKGFLRRPSYIMEADGNFGWSLVSLGEVAGIGKGVFAVGAFSGSGENTSLSGTVNIYQGGDVPRLITRLAGEVAMDKFGYTLSSGDLNGDGIFDLAVGAPFHSPASALYQRGAVYVFFGPGYESVTAVKIPATALYGGIGFSLAMGDLNGDGIDDLLLQTTGKVIVHYGDAGVFAPSAASPDVVFSSADSGFGRSMTLLPDLNGDGCREVAVSADQAVVDGVGNSGRLFILTGGRGNRTVNADLPSLDRLARIDGEPDGGYFGSVILPLSDEPGKAPDLAVSALHADGDVWPASGGIFILSGENLVSPSGSSFIQKFLGKSRDMHLGSFLAPASNGHRLVAGAPTENTDTGGVHIFNLDSSPQ